jgi:Mg2+ and Co2+ transporter CorA
LAFRLFVYDASGLEERAHAGLADVRAALAGRKRVWIDHAGALTPDQIDEIAAALDLGFHDIMEALEPDQRAGVAAVENATRVIATMAEGDGRFEPDQIAMFFNARFLLTLQRTQGDCLSALRTRLRNPQAKPHSRQRVGLSRPRHS